MKKQLIAIAIVVASGVSGFAQQTQIDSTQTKLDEVIVTASSKFELKRKDSGKPVIKITRADIEAQRAASISDLLNQYAGIEINGARSNAGQNRGLFVRGGNNRQVSILIDGAQVSDASSIAGDFDLRLLDLDQIEEIEILKGAASTLYGANASTAVINIKLRKAPENSTRVSVASFVGTNNSAENQLASADEFNNSVQLQGSAKNGLTYGVGFNHQSTDRLSAVESTDEFPNDADSFNRVNLLGRIGYNNFKDFKLSSYLSFDEFETEFDDAFTLTDANNSIYNRQVRWGTNMNWKYSEQGELVYADVSTHTRRDTRSGFPSIFNADGYSLDLYNKYTFDLGEESSLRTIVGFNFRSDQYEDFSIPFGETNLAQNANTDDVNAQIYDPYVNAVYVSDFGLNVNAGARLNMHSDYNSHLVYNLNPSYRFNVNDNAFKIYGSISTAYITPSLFQLFSGSFGNEDLSPEENMTIETGISWFMNKTSITATAFYREEENIVLFFTDQDTFASQYINADGTLIARGIEIQAQTELFDILRLTGNYAFTKRDNVDLLRRIPEHRANFSAQITPFENFNTTLRYSYSDIRGDAFTNLNTFASEPVVLGSYQLVDLDLTYKLKNKDVTFFTGVSNIFNEEYQEIFGFQTRGRNYKVGVRLGF